MVRKSDSEKSRHLRLVPSTPPLPAVAPVLRPDAPVSPADDLLVTGLARHARLGDREARDLLWRAFAPRLEPALLRCARLTYQSDWARRDGQPWAREDLRQEAWLVFAELIDDWNGAGSFVPYITAYFPWQLRKAIQRLGPAPRRAPVAALRGPSVSDTLRDAECTALLAMIDEALSPLESTILTLRVRDDARIGAIARRLNLSRRTIDRHWAHIRRVAAEKLRAAPDAAHGPE